MNKFMDRHERATYELNGARSGLERRPTFKISTPGRCSEYFQFEATPEFIGRAEALRDHLAGKLGKTPPPRGRLAAALIGAAWRRLDSHGNIETVEIDYTDIKALSKVENPLEKLLALEQHLRSQGLEFPKNGPTGRSATARLLVELAYDAMMVEGSFETMKFDYTL